jgi:hypothetical protein
LTSSSCLDFGSLLSPVHIQACQFLYHRSLTVESWQVLWVTWSSLNLLSFLAILVYTHTSLFHYLKDSTRQMSLSDELGFGFFSILVRMLVSTVLSRCFVIAWLPNMSCNYDNKYYCDSSTVNPAVFQKKGQLTTLSFVLCL